MASMARPKCKICGLSIYSVAWKGHESWHHLGTAAGKKAEADHTAAPKEK